MRKVSAESEKSMHQSPVKCMHSTLQSAARSLKKKMHRVSAQMYLRATVQDVYAVYKMRVISQNSRRKASVEDERSNALYA